MKTLRKLYPETTLMCKCELERCPICQEHMEVAYSSRPKMVQTMRGVLAIAHLPKRCTTMECIGYMGKWKSATWQQIAPRSCTYGYRCNGKSSLSGQLTNRAAFLFA